MGSLFFPLHSNVEQGGDWIFQEMLENDAFLASLLPPRAPLSTFRIVTATVGPITDATAAPLSYREEFFALTCVFRAGRQG